MSSSEFSLNVRPRSTSRARTSAKPVPLNAMWSTGPVDGARVEIGMPTFFVHCRVALPLGDVDARRVAEIEPEAGEIELGPKAFRHAEHVAVEVPRPVDVVAEHEIVLETLQRHRAPLFLGAVYRIPSDGGI